jgi:hypothetical protein
MIVGEVYGAWTVLALLGQLALVRCKCGTERSIRARNLPSGRSRSCGCKRVWPRTAIERFQSKIKTTEGCWHWRGGGDRYGQFWFQGRLQLAHRVSYQLFVGDIPEGLELDHLCRNTKCVNPSHLEAVTHEINCQRHAETVPIVEKCPQGHARLTKGERCLECAADSAVHRYRASKNHQLRKYTCSLCGINGHNARRCPQKKICSAA